MKDIFEFNHIDKSLSESDVTTLKDFYSHYHKKYWCFKRSYKSYLWNMPGCNRNYCWWNNTKPCCSRSCK